MRSYIFTDVERDILGTYITKGTKVKDFYVLLTRIRANHSRLKDDMKRLERVLEKERVSIALKRIITHQ